MRPGEAKAQVACMGTPGHVVDGGRAHDVCGNHDFGAINAGEPNLLQFGGFHLVAVAIELDVVSHIKGVGHEQPQAVLVQLANGVAKDEREGDQAG